MLLYVRPEIRAALRFLAAERGASMSAIVSSLIAAAARKAGYDPPA